MMSEKPGKKRWSNNADISSESDFDQLWEKTQKEMAAMDAEFETECDPQAPGCHVEYRKFTRKLASNKSSKTVYYVTEDAKGEELDSSDDSGINSKRQTPNPEGATTKSTMEYRFKVPGYHGSEVKVAVVGNKLIVEAERKDGKKSKGGYKREVSLSKHVDPKSVNAKLKDGMLKVTFLCVDV